MPSTTDACHGLLLEPCLQAGSKVMDVGCGSGFLTSCMAHMVGGKGTVYAIDYLEGLVELSVGNIEKSDGDFLKDRRVQCILGDG